MSWDASIKTSASHLVDDLVTSGSFSADQVSACDYGVLDSAGGCAVVVVPTGWTTDYHSYGLGNLAVVWNLRVECYVKDTGNPVTTQTRIWDIQDAVCEAVATGTCSNAEPRRARPAEGLVPDVVVNLGGPDLYPVYVTVRVEELS